MIDEAGAVERARLLAAGGRRLVGICGPPGASKSTLAARLAAAVDGAVVVGMDGFHLAHSTLERLGLTERKGAIETYDGDGFVALIERIRRQRTDDGPIWAPEFRRQIEDSIAAAVEVRGDSALVIVEGNYLLDPSEPWNRLTDLLDEIWYVDLDDDIRRTRLQARHEVHGRTPEQARERAWGNDERNSARISASRDRADAVIELG